MSIVITALPFSSQEEGIEVVLMNPNIASVQTNAVGEKQVRRFPLRSLFLFTKIEEQGDQVGVVLNFIVAFIF